MSPSQSRTMPYIKAYSCGCPKLMAQNVCFERNGSTHPATQNFRVCQNHHYLLCSYPAYPCGPCMRPAYWDEREPYGQSDRCELTALREVLEEQICARQRSSPNGQKGEQRTRLRRRKGVHLKHRQCVRPYWSIPETVYAELTV